MHIKSAEYLYSFKEVGEAPKEAMPEFAFIGRSNVGKSSLINMLCRSKSLVKVSNTPGKTQSLNYFLINKALYFVDLPGYGFAKVSKKERKSWEGMIKNYLEQREQLRTVLVLIDSRHEPQQNDLEFVNYLGEKQIPFVLVFTKADKSGRGNVSRNLLLFKNKMKENWEEIPPVFVTSAAEQTGRDEILGYIGENSG